MTLTFNHQNLTSSSSGPNGCLSSKDDVITFLIHSSVGVIPAGRAAGTAAYLPGRGSPGSSELSA